MIASSRPAEPGGISVLRRIGPAAGGAALVLAFGLLMVWGGRRLGDGQLPPLPGSIIAEPAALSASPQAAAVEIVEAPASRVVTAADATPEDERFGGLQREAPRAPLGPSPLEPKAPAAASPFKPPPPPGPPKPTLLFHPVATAAGRIQAGGQTVEVAGIKILDSGARCAGAKGEWPCGMVARTAFRAWLRGRAVECTVPPAPSEKAAVSSCRLGRQDAGDWLVRNGFAEAGAGGAYEKLGEEAKAARRGIFGDGPEKLPLPVIETGPGFGEASAEAPAAEGSPVPPPPAADLTVEPSDQKQAP